MATKNNPGTYDCYAKAEPDEPIFILLGRDRHAPTLVWLWAVLRELDGEDQAKIDEARACCLAMIHYLDSKQKKAVGIGQSVLSGMLDLIRVANMAVAAGAKNSASDEDTIRRFLAATSFSEPDTKQESSNADQ